MRKLIVNIQKHEDLSYPVIIGRNILGQIIPETEKSFPGKKLFILTDRNVEKAGFLNILIQKRKVPIFVINPPGETSKNINTVLKIISRMEKLSLGRDTILLALGGGTVGDIGGFVAGIFKRGIPFVQIPTTTVAQADSSVGGKVGVDSELSKNAYGVFKQPIRVYIDVETLLGLDERNYRAGLVETVKHGLIRDSEFFGFLEKNIEKILKRDLRVLEEMAYRNCRIKGDVVSIDPEEKNLRSILNYGHTIGHAIESESKFELLHGEAVAVGMLAAGRIGEVMELLSENDTVRIKSLLAKFGMPDKIPKNIKFSGIIKAMTRDKKSLNQKPRFVLLEKIGKVYCLEDKYAVGVADGLIKETIKRFLTTKGTKGK